MGSAKERYDVIVVGAGIEGSSTAYQLAKRGKRVLLLEQFALPHKNGSSHGPSRITRRSYEDREFYTRMMTEAFDLLHELETECGQQLFINCGYMAYCEKDNQFIKHTKDVAERSRLDYEYFDVNEQRRRFPYLQYPDDYVFFLERSGGILRSDKMLQASQMMFTKYGGTIKDNQQVVDIRLGDLVEVVTNQQKQSNGYLGNNVVLTMGPWATTFLPRIGIHLSIKMEAIRVMICYWREKNAGEFDISKFPAFYHKHAIRIDNLDAFGGSIYGCPSFEYKGLVKLCLHHGTRVDMNHEKDAKNDSKYLEVLKQYVASHFPTLYPVPAIVDTCYYTNTEDTNFILDVHPQWNNVIIGAGFSGHGFKLSPVVGKILADLSTQKQPSYDLTPFKINRTANISKSRL